MYYAQHGSMDISKYSIAHSHAWATGHMYAVLINVSELQMYMLLVRYCI